MTKCVLCKVCGAKVNYIANSVCAGNRDYEDIDCPRCGTVLFRVFTDVIPTVWIAKEEQEHTCV